MGRHRTAEEKLVLSEQARELRAAGRSRREIQAELGIGDDLAKQLLSGVPLPDSLRRPRAKDDLRAQAVELREQGLAYNGIAAELGVSKSTLSLWLRDVHVPVERRPPAAVDLRQAGGYSEPAQAARQLRADGLLLREIAQQLDVSIKSVSLWTAGMPWPERSRHGGDAEHVKAMAEARWGAFRRRRDIAAQQRKLDAALSIGRVDDRALLLLGAVAYWCEGTKSKPWRRQGKFTFVNSDPLLMRLMVQWLRMLDVSPDRWIARIQIHETADVAAAERYWRHILGLPGLEFGNVNLKRHKPLTKRKNLGEGYHGCVSIYVRNGAELLQQIEGWMVGALLGCGGALPADPVDWSPRCDDVEVLR